MDLIGSHTSHQNEQNKSQRVTYVDVIEEEESATNVSPTRHQTSSVKLDKSVSFKQMRVAAVVPKDMDSGQTSLLVKNVSRDPSKVQEPSQGGGCCKCAIF